jgi:hypothetical protein
MRYRWHSVDVATRESAFESHVILMTLLTNGRKVAIQRQVAIPFPLKDDTKDAG